MESCNPFPYASDDVHSTFSVTYRVIKMLGKGAYGIVHHCVHRVSDIEYAVKVIDARKIPRELKVMLEREEKIVSKLSHPNIVRFHESIWEPTRRILVFEFLKGGQLYHDIRRKSHYSELDSSTCIEQIFKGIAYCHKKNIIHRDLKLDNILLASTWPGVYVKLIDFGLAIEVGGKTKHKSLLHGSSEYTAPEVIKDEAPGKPADLWACGVVLYKLLVGLHPLPGTITDGHREAPPLRWSTVSFAAKDLVGKLLQLPRKARITADEALKHEFITNRELTSSSSENLSSSSDGESA